MYTDIGVRRSLVATFAAIRLRGPRFKPRPGQKFETRILLQSHLSGGEDVSPMQGEAIRLRYIKPEYLSYLGFPLLCFTRLEQDGTYEQLALNGANNLTKLTIFN